MYRRQLLETVSEYGKDKRFVVVGHSLGGAVATFASLELKNKGKSLFILLKFAKTVYFFRIRCVLRNLGRAKDRGR